MHTFDFNSNIQKNLALFTFCNIEIIQNVISLITIVGSSLSIDYCAD
jgi:hypothetical protein